MSSPLIRRQQINSFLDMPAKELNLLLQVCIENDGKLSKRKRQDLFSDLTDEEVEKIEAALHENFPNGFKQYVELQRASKRVQSR